MSFFRLIFLGFFMFAASFAQADMASPLIEKSINNNSVFQNHLQKVSTASDIANSNSTINFICKRKPKPNIYKKLEKANMKKLEKELWHVGR
jgi:hypothetical protein